MLHIVALNYKIERPLRKNPTYLPNAKKAK